MAKNTKFNFGGSPAAKEISGAMQTVAEQPDNSPKPTFPRKVKEKKEDWTLTQCRLPNELHGRMRDYCYHEDISINEFIIVAVREMLSKV